MSAIVSSIFVGRYYEILYTLEVNTMHFCAFSISRFGYSYFITIFPYLWNNAL